MTSNTSLIPEILKKLENEAPNSLLAEHVKHTVNQPAPNLTLCYQLKVICALAPVELEKILGENLVERIKVAEVF